MSDQHNRKMLAEGPAIILVEPQLGENIGFAARAMANFGLAELRLVNPRDGWPSDKARAAASRADHVIDATTVHPTLAAGGGKPGRSCDRCDDGSSHACRGRRQAGPIM